VPEVIALDISEFELPHLILTFMDGKPSRDSIAAHDGGAWLRRVHSMELPGWGPLGDRARPGPSRGRHQSSREAISNQLSGLRQLVAAGVIDSAGPIGWHACSGRRVVQRETADHHRHAAFATIASSGPGIAASETVGST
jgi:hypothetical protein